MNILNFPDQPPRPSKDMKDSGENFSTNTETIKLIDRRIQIATKAIDEVLATILPRYLKRIGKKSFGEIPSGDTDVAKDRWAGMDKEHLLYTAENATKKDLETSPLAYVMLSYMLKEQLDKE